jgi:carbon-monoxide dehydrogenase medium subunit
MYPANFEYYRAGSVQEAVSLLQAHSGAKVLAGGHSLIPAMKIRLAEPPVLVDIGRIPGLSRVEAVGGSLRVGALTTHASLAASDVLHKNCPILSEAAAQIADAQVRHKGTIGGNLAHADPGSDLPGVMLALEGVFHVMGAGGERQIRAADFFVDLLTTDLKPGEVLTAVEIPALGGRTGSCYLKFEHPASGYAVVGAAAIVTLEDGGTCREARLAFNGVTSTPYRAAEVEAELIGKRLDEATIAAAIEKLNIQDPIDDPVYASGAYRVHLARVYGKNALLQAAERAGSTS